MKPLWLGWVTGDANLIRLGYIDEATLIRLGYIDEATLVGLGY